MVQLFQIYSTDISSKSPEVMMMMVPEAWEKHQTMSEDRKAYYENEQNGTAGWWSHHFQNKYNLIYFTNRLLIILLGIL